MADTKPYVGPPVVAAIVGTRSSSGGGAAVLHVSDVYGTDRRDQTSYYAAITTEIEKPVVFLFQQDPKTGPDIKAEVVLQAVQNRSVGGQGLVQTNGMYLSVHKIYGTDTQYPGYIRAILQPDINKAVVWSVRRERAGTVFTLSIKENRDASAPETTGWFLAVPPDSVRDSVSNYLAVTPSEQNAMTFSIPSVKIGEFAE